MACKDIQIYRNFTFLPELFKSKLDFLEELLEVLHELVGFCRLAKDPKVLLFLG